MEDNRQEWDYFRDMRIWLNGEDKSIMQLRRKYFKIFRENDVEVDRCPMKDYLNYPNLAPVVAQGISAFLSFEDVNSINGISLRYLLKKKGAPIYNTIYKQYYEYCLNFLKIENEGISLPSKQKSETELILLHLRNEKKLLKESHLLFNEVLDEEKKIIDKIRKAALDYPLWVKEMYIAKKEETQEITIPPLKDNKVIKQTAQDLIVVLSGCWVNGEKIMTDKEYKKVVEGILFLIDSGQVRQIGKKIQTSAPQQFIRRLFWTIHKELYSIKSTKKDSFIEFLHAYFECFTETEKKTTNNNFKEYRSGDFDKDYKKVSESINK
jgi:hypothetical protein